ncbi:HD family phosphohydrolase [Pleomorphochaeta sp. DL1XJH-081]|uniref:HD family phosphohydrolase n=1 Tax=Pleomorphochaeta sp. DL1XJH-081 TaxID=3409690 RepID=UPI003BB6E803
MKKTRTGNNRYSDQPLWLRLLVPVLGLAVAIGALVVPVLIANDSKLLTTDVKSRFQAGTIAEHDVRANETFHYVDEAETKRRQQAAVQAINPIFKIALVPSRAMLSDIASLFDPSGAQVDSISSELVARIYNLADIERRKAQAIVRELAETYIAQGVFNEAELLTVQQQGYTEIQVDHIGTVGDETMRELLPVSEALHVNELSTRIHADLREISKEYSEDLLMIVFDSLREIMRPNVHFDPVATALSREEAASLIPPVIVRVEKGQYILVKDYVITDDDIRTIQAMRLASVQYTPSQMFGRVFFVIIITISAMYAFHMAFIHSKRELQFFLIFLTGILVTQILTFVSLKLFMGLGFLSMESFLPVFILPIFLALITNRKRVGMIAAVALASYAVLLPTATVTTVFLLVSISFTGIYFIRFVSKRIDMVFEWFFGIIAASFIVLLNNLVNGYGFSQVLQSIAAISANVSVTYILVSLFMPMIELVLNLPTPFRLRELAFSDSPALVRLSQNAVGTYNHSMMVAEMAYAAAKEIDADPLLARVAALYHDIGKQEHPEYFIENQSGDNKHDDLKASLSVAIIKSHVKIGIEKGREARLPQEVLDIISQHHGNDVIAIFLKEAQDAAIRENSKHEVKRQDYAYNNQIPQSPEAAIVMLADSIEAASRTVKKPSAQKYEKLVNQIIMGKIERKQLAACRLSLTDLESIARVFVQILTGRFHTRIDYPDVDKEEKT